MNIHTSIKVISSSIKDRGSKQGEKVFTAALEQLTELDSFLKNNKELINENEVGVYIALRERMLE